ncbi:MAG: glutamine synthetase [bacterium]|nr:glutamine synthetase [bacterium]
MSSPGLRDFLELSYAELEDRNLAAKRQRAERADPAEVEEERRRYLADEKRIKAVTVCFSDVEGRLHMLDYDKNFLLRSADNLTFDGSSIRGFAVQAESDLKLSIDWPAFYWLPADVFGPGKVVVFAEVRNRDDSPYPGDFRSLLHRYADRMHKHDGTTAYVAPEIEGFLFKGPDAERRYHETGCFEFISTGGYYHSLPQDPLRQFMDAAAEVQRAMGFGNEKDHPEVAPSQFEMNFSYAEACITADQIQLYKLLCRQVAQRLGMTASFLPKPVAGINGCGMHTNISLERGEKNIFYEADGRDGLSGTAWEFIDRILHSAPDICLVLNSSVNGYRRLDPEFEAPNQIKVSAVNRAAMVRIPLANQRTARIEVRSVGPDANPYLLIYSLLRTGLEGPRPDQVDEEKRPRTRFLPGNIYDALRLFKGSRWVTELLGEDVQSRLLDAKQRSADRCPRELGALVKRGEVMFHHEVTNQYLWGQF